GSRTGPGPGDLVLRRDYVQELRGAPRHRARRSARSHSGRDGRALPRAGSPSRQAQRAGLRGRDGAHGGRGEGGRPRGARRCDARQHAARLFEARNGRAGRLSLRLTILGCGSSAGVPRVGQGWGACDPDDPRNRRRRCAVLVERFASDGLGSGVTTVLVDTGPDMREQLIDAEVTRLDGVLMTHSHADHTHGIDDLRPIYLMARRRIDVHMDEPTSLIVRNGFSYIFQSPEGSSYPPIATDLRLSAGSPCRVEGPGGTIEAVPFDLDHGEINALGFRF